MIQLLNPLTALMYLLEVEVMEHIGLKHIMKVASLRLENFTRKMEIMIVGVMIIGVVMVEVSEPLTLL
jgi:hypothetical protein